MEESYEENYAPAPAAQAKQSNVVEIKLKGSEEEDEVIEIDLDNLPDGEDALGIVKQEEADLHTWVRIAIAYYKKGDVKTFERILELSGSDAKLDYEGFERDQMKALDALAAFYCSQARKERAKAARKELMGRATVLYTTADKIIIYDINHLLGRAFFCFLENNYDQADAQFKYILGQVQDNIPALLGEACISFNKKDYKGALFFYKKAMSFNADCPGADVRMGIGLCYFKLGRHDKARLAFERALQMDGGCIGALIGLAILEGNSATEEGVKRGVELLVAAYHADTSQPMVLNHLANHFFFRKEYDKVMNLAKHALSLSEVDALRAESCYQLARNFHVRRDYDQALQYYYQATQLAAANFVLPFFGLGQMYIDRRDYEKAIDAFEKVLKAAPDNYETLKILGSLYANCDVSSDAKRKERRHKAREYLAKVVGQKEYEDDVEAWIDYAQLLEPEDATEALRAYERSECLLRDTVGVPVPPEILNNIGSCHYALADYDKAKLHFDAALVRIESEADGGDECRALRVTVQYNQARAMEQLCALDQADQIYRAILQRKPNYIDCYFRLGCMARDRGDLHEANERFKEALQYRQNSATAWTLIGNLHMTKGELLPVQKKFEQILKFKDYTDDPYSVVALGNVWLETLYMPHKDKEKEKRHRERALQMYSKALKVAPTNIWAANGIGCALACRGQMQEARDVFAQVREATADFADVWLNIAHVYVEVKKYVAAIQMYENCMKKFNMQLNVDVLLYLARAQFRAGKLHECKATLLIARQVSPHDALVVLNTALLLKQMALIALKDEKAGLAPVLAAVDNLHTAEKYLAELASATGTLATSATHHKHVDRARAADESRQCADMSKQAQHHVARARRIDQEQRTLRAKQEAERNAILDEQTRVQREREDSARQQMEKLKEQRQMFINKTKDILFIPEVKEEPKPSASAKRRSGRPPAASGEFVNDSSDLGEYVGEAGGERPAKRRQPVSKESRRERRERRKERRERRRRMREGDAPPSDDDDDDEDGEGDEEDERRERAERSRAQRTADEGLSAAQRAKVKSKAIVSSSGSSSSEADKRSNKAAGDGGGPSSDDDDNTIPRPNVPTVRAPGVGAAQTASMKRVSTDSSDESSDDNAAAAGGGAAKRADSTSSSGGGARARRPPPAKKGRVTKKTASSSEESAASDDAHDADCAAPTAEAGGGAAASSDGDEPAPAATVDSDKSDGAQSPQRHSDSAQGATGQEGAGGGAEDADDSDGSNAPPQPDADKQQSDGEDKAAAAGSASDDSASGSADGGGGGGDDAHPPANEDSDGGPAAKAPRVRNPSSSDTD